MDDQPGVLKATILYFAGDTREQDMTYSHGVRQTIRAMFHDRPGIVADLTCVHALGHFMTKTTGHEAQDEI